MSSSFDLASIPSVRKIEVAVDGVKTPLSIGDNLKILDTDTLTKTVVAIQVFEDNRILYTLEWLDTDGEFKQEIVSLTELKLLNANQAKRPKIGI